MWATLYENISINKNNTVTGLIMKIKKLTLQNYFTEKLHGH